MAIVYCIYHILCIVYTNMTNDIMTLATGSRGGVGPLLIFTWSGVRYETQDALWESLQRWNFLQAGFINCLNGFLHHPPSFLGLIFSWCNVMWRWKSSLLLWKGNRWPFLRSDMLGLGFPSPLSSLTLKNMIDNDYPGSGICKRLVFAKKEFVSQCRPCLCETGD